MSSLTVAELAQAKRLPEDFLRGLGLRDTDRGVAIPYHDERGQPLFERIRQSLDGARRFLQPAGVSLQAYGVDRLQIQSSREQGFLVVVEGESDSWTLWNSGLPALGLPGASAAKTLRSEHIEGFQSVYVIREPGQGGAAFVKGVAERLPQIGFTGEAYEVPFEQYKDPSALYCDDPERFQERLLAALNHVVPLVCTAETQRDRASYKRGTDNGQTESRCSGFRSVAEYLAAMKERSEKKALWGSVLRKGETSLLLGRAYAGKSTFACALARALTLGVRLMGRECPKTRVGYMALERNGSTVAKLFEKWGLADIQFLDEAPVMPMNELAEFLRAQIEQHGLEVVIVDHLQNLMQINDGNDYAGVSNALEPFQHIAKNTGCHLILLHHQPKTRREGEIDCMGSEAYRAAADVLIEASQSDQRHYIRAHVRAGEDLPRTLVTVSLDTGEVRAIEAIQAEIESAETNITAFLETQAEAATADVIRPAVQLKAKVVSDALKTGVEDGAFVRTGTGKRGDPYLYQTVEFYSRGAGGRAGMESANVQNNLRTEPLNQFPDDREEKLTEGRQRNENLGKTPKELEFQKRREPAGNGFEDLE
jgi:hypothetical protein